MSDNLPLDNHIQQQLGNYAPDVPPHIWSQIVVRREEQRPKGFWVRFFNGRSWLMVAALLLVAGGAAYWISRPTTNQDSNTAQNVGTTELVAKNTAPTNPSTISNKLDAAQPNTTNSTNPSATPSSNNNNTANTTITQAQDPSVGNRATNNSLHFLLSPNNHFVSQRDKSVYLPVKKQATSKATNKSDDAADDTFSLVNDDPAAQGNTLGSINLSLPRLLYGGLTPLPSSKQTTGELHNKLLAGIILPDCPSIEDNAAANKKYFELYAGPDLGIRSFGSFNNDTTSTNYLQKRKESARFSSAFSAGVRYTKVFNNGMSLRTGVNYSQINEKFKYINPRDIRYVLVITPRDIISGGNVVTVYDTVRYTQTGTREKITYNRYRSIDVPLQLGYEFGNGRLHTNISAGAIVNLYSWHKGDVLDSAYQPVSITTGKTSAAYGYKTNIGVGFLGSVSLYYKLTPRMHVMAEPYFRYNLQPMTRDNQNITQKYSTLGLRLGLRWDLK